MWHSIEEGRDEVVDQVVIKSQKFQDVGKGCACLNLSLERVRILVETQKINHDIKMQTGGTVSIVDFQY